MAHTAETAVGAIISAIRIEARGTEKEAEINEQMDIIADSNIVTIAAGIDGVIKLKHQIEDQIAANQAEQLDADQAELDDMQAAMENRQSAITARRAALTEQIEGDSDTEEQEKPAETVPEDE